MIAFGHSSIALDDLPDDRFLQAIAWKRSAPNSLMQEARTGDYRQFCQAFRKQVPRKKNFPKYTDSSNSSRLVWSSLWSRNLFQEPSRVDLLVKFLDELSRNPKTKGKNHSNGRLPNKTRSDKHSSQKSPMFRQGYDWLDALTDGKPVSPFELLILQELLTKAFRLLPNDLAWKFWRIALTGMIDFSNHLKESEERQFNEDPRPLVAAELFWKAGLLFSGVKGSGKLRRHGSRSLQRQLLEMTDSDGTPHADLVERLPFGWLPGFGQQNRPKFIRPICGTKKLQNGFAIW